MLLLPYEWGTEKRLGKRKKISQKYTANTMTILRSGPIVLFSYQTQVIYYFVEYYVKAKLPLYGLGQALGALSG
jgi:hypothetical protein